MRRFRARSARDLQPRQPARPSSGNTVQPPEDHGDDWTGAGLRRLWDTLSEADPGGQLRQSLEHWFLHDMRLALAADALGLHRNTLLYRLRRIEEICGVDLRRTDDLLRLYLSLRVSMAAAPFPSPSRSGDDHQA